MAGSGKKMTPAPIDRPLSKAYLRKFTGWSTAAPPGMSDPTTLRSMHNCSIAPDGSLRIRPGLRHVFEVPADHEIVGTLEHFYTNSGKKAFLFAVREDEGQVTFRIAVYNSTIKMFQVKDIDDPVDGFTVTGSLDFASDTTYVKYVQIDNRVLALSDNDEPFRMFWVGSEKKAKAVSSITVPTYTNTDKLSVILPDDTWIAGSQNTVPDAETLTADTLISMTAEDNKYNFGYFYTFNNEIGESAPSRVTVVKTKRSWSTWHANASDDTISTDQLAAIMPNSVWTAAVAQGAVSWNLYMMTWSDEDPVPVEGVLLKTVDLSGGTYDTTGWATHTPLLQGDLGSKALPNVNNLDNFTKPSAGGQGIVAGDRLVMVYDKTEAARIRWSSNQQGDYMNFSSSKGGGYKTLTSGNLYFPACVKLWQNPQSVDTLTVLCMGLDGYGTAYYMNPNTGITAQSQTVSIMGFEETTATPGTVSPYGCEVLNNALYHPLENNLMKSSASNYNINHAMMADEIQNIWHQVPLANKRRIVSSQMDSTLYYLIQSPVGWNDDTESNGNQIWMCDTAQSNIWSCWDVAGTALHKIEIDGLLYMGITSGKSVYVFDPEWDHDDVWFEGGPDHLPPAEWREEGIPWEAVTNTQGANRAHDAWCHLQQANVTFGNFTGECVYGIRGKDINGKMVDVQKHYVSPQRGHNPLDRYDQSDMLLIRRDLVEWEFYWKSAERPRNRSYGSVNYVQYRYTPVTVNVGYEYGSVETFEYGNRSADVVNGVPTPFADVSKP